MHSCSDLHGKDGEVLMGSDDTVLHVLFVTFRMLLLGDGAVRLHELVDWMLLLTCLNRRPTGSPSPDRQCMPW